MRKRAAVWLALAPVVAGPAVAAVAATGGQVSPTTTSTRTGTTHQATQTSSQNTAPSSTPKTTQDTAPPAGDAEATAVGVAGVAAVGHTKAHADAGSATADANAVELGGKPLIDGKTGGSQTDPGKSSGALLDTGTTPLGRLELTPWSASSQKTGTGTSAASDAALARLTVLDPAIATLVVLGSHSDASYNSSGSQGSASSDGAVLNVGDGKLVIDLLHSESKSGESGSSYLVSINGTEIGSSDQANGACVVNIPSLVQLTCLSASGGAGSAASSGTVGEVVLANGQLPTGTVSGTTSEGAPTQSTSAQSEPPGGTQVLGEQNGPKASSTGNTNNNAGVPFTGFDAMLIALAAGSMVAGGAVFTRLGRRRRAMVVA